MGCSTWDRHRSDDGGFAKYGIIADCTYCITKIFIVGYRRDTNTSVKMEEQQVETDGITAGGAGGSETRAA